jgi:hypothetical protein
MSAFAFTVLLAISRSSKEITGHSLALNIR